MSEKTSTLDPVPQHSDVVDEKGKVSPVWTRWFIKLRTKINVIADSLVNLAGVATAGILSTDGNGNWFARTLTGTANDITVTSGTGAAGNPVVSSAATGVTAGSYISANITVRADGKITAAANGGGSSSGGILPVVTGDTPPELVYLPDGNLAYIQVA